MSTPIHTAIKLVEKCMAPKHETEANVAYGAVIRILKDLLPEEAASLKGAGGLRWVKASEFNPNLQLLYFARLENNHHAKYVVFSYLGKWHRQGVKEPMLNQELEILAGND